MSWLKDSLDTLQGYGTSIIGTAGTTLKGVGDATVKSINDTIANAGKASSAVPETHAAVPTGQTANGSTVVPLPTAASGMANAAGMPTWAIALLGVSAVAVVGGGLYLAVKK